MEAPAGETGFYRIMVAIETDATRYYGPDATRPALLETSDAEQLLAHLAADLKALLPEIADCSLIAAGALYDQTQVLRPGFPVFGALEATSISRREDRFRARLVSIGAHEGRMPRDELQPLDDIPLGLLQLLPVVVQGPAETVAGLGQAMEYRFMEEGQLSAHSAAWMQTAFSVTINHARFMTLTDLNAMLRLQLEHFGFLPMWELLDAALNGEASPLDVTTPGGQEYHWRDGAVYTEFQTFDHWAGHGGGAGALAARQALAEGYGNWTREQRQYLTTLRAHGVDLRFRLPGSDRDLEGSFVAEDSPAEARGGDAAVTEHSYEELGTVAITAVESDQVRNYYPLSPGGLNDVHSHLKDRVPGGQTVSFPGTVLYSEKNRCLVPDSSGVPSGNS